MLIKFDVVGGGILIEIYTIEIKFFVISQEQE